MVLLSVSCVNCLVFCSSVSVSLFISPVTRQVPSQTTSSIDAGLMLPSFADGGAKLNRLWVISIHQCARPKKNNAKIRRIIVSSGLRGDMSHFPHVSSSGEGNVFP